MSAFSVTPVSNIPPPNAEEFPNFIQFQQGGENLGGPDADTLNFGAGLTATRGVGENSNVVTVVGGGSASVAVGVIDLVNSAEDGLFDDTPFPSSWDVSVPLGNDAYSFEDQSTTLTFAESGVYRVTATCALTAQIEGFAWPSGESHYGSVVGDSSSQHYRSSTEVDYQAREAIWTDQHVVQVETAPMEVTVQLYAGSSGDSVGRCSMTLVVERLGD